MKLKITEDMIEAAVVGGCVLGGGGGGPMDEGRMIGELAIGLSDIQLVDIEDLDKNSVLINVAAVGAPSAKEAHAKPLHYLRAAELLNEISGTETAGIITNEAGGLATVNGWLQAAMLGVPVVDAPCNGRAHPTSLMGAMGLHRDPDYTSIQTAVGGDKEKGSYIEVTVAGKLEKTSAIIRNVSVQAGGLVAVARNPVTCAYARENAALGAVKQAIDLGREMIKAVEKGSEAVIKVICESLGGELISKGTVENVELISKGGFDVGKIMVEGDFEITFWNEYMTLEHSGERIATFPDLVITVDALSGLPLTSAEMREGRSVAIIRVDKKRIKLGAGMKDPELFRVCEEAVGKKLIEVV